MGRYISRNLRWHPSPTYHSWKHLSPPRNNKNNSTIRNFTNELSTVLNEFTKFNHNIVITGDFNINLLEFLDMMILSELFPKITLPTRKCKTKVSLIDQNFCRFKYFNKRIKSGIILGATSDHYAYFQHLKSVKHTNQIQNLLESMSSTTLLSNHLLWKWERPISLKN